MIGKVIKVAVLNKEFNVIKYGVKLLNEKLIENETIYSLFDRSIPKSLYEKVGIVDEYEKDGLVYQIIEIDNNTGEVTLENYGETTLDNIISFKQPIYEDYYYVKLIFVYDDLIFNKRLRTYSSPKFIKTNGFYEDFKEFEENGDRVKYKVDLKELELSHKYIQLVSLVPDDMKQNILEVKEASDKLEEVTSRLTK